MLGNLDAKRDWGYAGDYVKAMWVMLQQDEPDDYVVATGETHSVREFLEPAFSAAGHRRLGAATCARTPASSARPRWTCWWATPPRPRPELGWKPEVDFRGLVERMVQHDLEVEAEKAANRSR